MDFGAHNATAEFGINLAAALRFHIWIQPWSVEKL